MIRAFTHYQGKFSVLLAYEKDRLLAFEVNVKLSDKNHLRSSQMASKRLRVGK
jgi:hypothetical protein